MEIKRDIIDHLKEWKTSTRRKPLVLQGARQVGKSWALKKFGKECFESTVYINFDTMPTIKEDFARTKEPRKLLKILEMTMGQAINPDSTLIIFDEIQECNDALNSLKYFCEDAREYCIVCAGSLLGVALNRSGASFPVGKVDFMRLQPVSFAEYLRATNAKLYASYELFAKVDGETSAMKRVSNDTRGIIYQSEELSQIRAANEFSASNFLVQHRVHSQQL